ncbi:DNA polymerase-3 subunit gamma/tau [Thermanaeromonas toyohensis ToBE]|uniref:DNA-directed DNA polymerase n=1 Tax=Thermanaeromonas toyohensis ToBE TaxID=698762 RepID=A0A1W1V6J8_9FIRM|nr:DNA polymerase III subunit gamma/tau [Thermanaeromonas toyohensis]SMB89059.1 DNA polymerase-3 subunit gamma/tau [Thermanaeromonas toyohensis ToBE]
MSQYLALYRQWRPQTFQEVVGQEHITYTLRNAVRTGRLVHAYLFCGPRGTGKTSTAKILAKAANCRQPQDGEPCNSCLNCRRITEGLSLDVLEIDAASNRGIDEIRQLKEGVQLGPVEGKYKIYIIDEVHMLTTEAFNALLKTLEEPPPHVIFILATTEPRKVLPTIISRCQRFDFQALKVDIILKRLQEVVQASNVEIELQALQLLARKAGGGLRDALSLLDQILSSTQGRITAEQVATLLGVPREDALKELIKALLREDGSKILHVVDQVLREGIEPRRLLEELLDWCRNLLLLKLDPNLKELVNLPEETIGLIQELDNTLEAKRLFRVIEKLQSATGELRYSFQPRISLEMALLGVIMEKVPEGSEELASRIEKLEERLERLEKLLATRELTSTISSKAVSSSKGIEAPQTSPASAWTAVSGSFSVTPTGETRVELRTPREGKKRDASLETGLSRSGSETAVTSETAKQEGQQYLTIEEVRRLWPQILQAARQRSIHLQAYLKGGKPLALEGSRLILSFHAAFHRSMLEQPAHRQAVQEILQQVLGQPLEIVMVDGAGQEEPKEAKIPDATLKKLIDYFGQDKVEIKD